MKKIQLLMISMFKKMGFVRIGLCSVCCLLPMIAASIGMASVSALSFYLEKTGFILVLLGGAAFLYDLNSSKRKPVNCGDNCGCKADNSTENESMKISIILTAMALLIAPYAQAQQKAEPTPSSKTQKTLMMENQKDTVMGCKLTTPELQERKATVIKNLKDNFTKKIELENGYSYVFNGKDETLDMLTEFIKSERMCCDFFNFNIAVVNKGTITFSITGNKGAKEFIATELGL
ncbi:hypothetical protein [Pedobacter miscanthi]|uniref:hypothetical protein n=1 Tax=Pedobacter miscanthi TaxID=2259170 RepID=UPI002931A173|nr:hypothetical protein [Pedobacter miscanthi]